jgi:microcystin degradation protein MlrC
MGIQIESNSLAEPMDLDDFRGASGDELGSQLRRDGTILSGFGQKMDELREWDPVPIEVMTAAGTAGGPAEHAAFDAMLARQIAMLRAAGPVDAVLVSGHGAGTTTECDDLDGAYLRAIRDLVGTGVPIVVSLDPHANISIDMVDSADVLVSYLTNPHADIRETHARCAEVIHELLQGVQPRTAFVRLPIVVPQVVQRTAPGLPFGDLVARGQELLRANAEVLNVSCLSGFALGDTSSNGLAILVTTRADPESAEKHVLELARGAWADRHRYAADLHSIEDAVRLAEATGRDTTLPALALADVADNPGGGARSNTTWLISALHEAGVHDVQLGLFFDPALVAEAWELGVGATFDARLNRAEPDARSLPYTAAGARVVHLSEGGFRPSEGIARGIDRDLGRGCAIAFDGISLAVSSRREQLLDPSTLRHFGLEPDAARVFVIKSRGHFREGFEPLLGADRIVEVEAPGLMPQDLSNVQFQSLPGPVFPLDPDAEWDGVVTAVR